MSLTKREALLSAANNVDWYRTIVGSHGYAGEVASGIWLFRGAPPPYHSNAVTLSPDGIDAQYRTLHELRLALDGPFSFKDSFSVLDMTPAAGRFFTAADAPQGSNELAVLSYESWQRRFKGDARIVGRGIRVNGVEFTITGVAPRGFRGMRTLGFWPEMWVPVGMYATVLPGATGVLRGRGRGWLTTFARMKEGWDFEQTTAAAAVRSARARYRLSCARSRGTSTAVARSP